MEIFKATIFYIYLIEDIYFNDLCIIFYRYQCTYLCDFCIYMIENIYCKYLFTVVIYILLS